MLFQIVLYYLHIYHHHIQISYSAFTMFPYCYTLLLLLVSLPDTIDGTKSYTPLLLHIDLDHSLIILLLGMAVTLRFLLLLLRIS